MKERPLAREGGFYLDNFFARAIEFLVTPLLMGPVCLISQDRSAPYYACITKICNIQVGG